MCIICRMRNGYDCWLFLVVIDIIGDKLPQVTELPSVRVLHWVAAPHQGLCLLNHMETKSIIRGPFSGFKRKRRLKMNLMYGNTGNMSQVLILAWLGMTSSHTSQGSRKCHHSTLFLKLFYFTVILYKNIPFQMSMEHFNQYYENVLFILINVFFSKAVQLKIFFTFGPRRPRGQNVAAIALDRRFLGTIIAILEMWLRPFNRPCIRQPMTKLK